MSIAAELLGYLSLVVLGIVPIVNPFSTAPVFLSLTSNASPQGRRRLASQACFYMACLLLVFLLLGTYLLQFFGISMVSLRLAGGLIISYMGFRMLFPASSPAATADQGGATGSIDDLAFTPLALPMLCGPGSISVVLAMSTQVSNAATLEQQLYGYAVVAVGIVVSAWICWLVLWSSGAVVRMLGPAGIEAITKLMGFLLICMGMEFVLSAWKML